MTYPREVWWPNGGPDNSGHHVILISWREKIGLGTMTMGRSLILPRLHLTPLPKED